MTHLLLIESLSTEADSLQQMLIQAANPGTLEIVWLRQIPPNSDPSPLNGYDVILLGLYPAEDGSLGMLTALQSAAIKTPVVVMVEDLDQQLPTRVMELGVQDCLIKGAFSGKEMLRVIQHAMDRKRVELTLERRARELEALYETSLEINAQIDLPTLLQALVERAVRLLGLPLGGLYLVRPDNQSLILAYTVNIKKDYRGTTLQFGEGVSGRVAQTGRPLAVANYQEWEGRANIFAGSDFKRVLAVPLKAGGKIIGVINLSDDRSTGSWSSEDIRLASLFADQAAIAVHNASLLEAERKKSAELVRSNAVIAALGQMTTRLGETLNLSMVFDTLGNELHHLDLSVELLLYEGDAPQELVTQYISLSRQQVALLETTLGQKILGVNTPLEIRSLAEALIIERKGRFIQNPLPYLAIAFPDVPRAALETAVARIGVSRFTAVLCLPLIIKDHPLGVMFLWGGDLRESDLMAFTIFSNQVAVALENARLYNRIERLATLDELTSLYNRRGFFLLAEQQLRMAQRSGTEVLLIFCDVDQLKKINDTYGHKEGDRALVLTADTLRSSFRSADILARISGDEFAVFAYASPGISAPYLMERLKREVERINAYTELPFTLGLSAGFSLWSPSQPVSLDELLAQADTHMYRVKRKKITGELNPGNVTQ